ncbi:hypothetical protein [Kribbella sp. NPDC003557]|uniref:hypothetical protein n=1 Tax=Kribbella sp. NPDC003557 TaxID=3154449 RepID=UPI0033BB4E40
MTRRWLIDLPTRIHLWSADLQIRHRPSFHPVVGLLTLAWSVRSIHQESRA